HGAGGVVEQRLLQRGLFCMAFGLQTLLEKPHDLSAQASQRVARGGIQLAWLAVDHTQRAEGVDVRRGQRHGGVEAYVRIVCDQRVVLEAKVLLRIADLEEALAIDGMGAEGNFAWGLVDLQPQAALEPLTMVVDQRDQCDGRIADMCRQMSEIVESGVVGWALIP